MGCPRKKANNGGGGMRAFLKNTFRFVTLPLEIPKKVKLHTWKFCNIVLYPLEIPMPKIKTHRNAT